MVVCGIVPLCVFTYLARGNNCLITVSLLVFLPLLKFLDILTVENVFCCFVLNVTY